MGVPTEINYYIMGGDPEANSNRHDLASYVYDFGEICLYTKGNIIYDIEVNKPNVFNFYGYDIGNKLTEAESNKICDKVKDKFGLDLYIRINNNIIESFGISNHYNLFGNAG